MSFDVLKKFFLEFEAVGGEVYMIPLNGMILEVEPSQQKINLTAEREQGRTQKSERECAGNFSD